MTDRDPAYDAADRAFDAHDGPWWNNDSAVLAAREALAPIRELHRLDKELSCGDGCCDTCECGHPWPCDTARLIYSSEELTND